MGKTPHKCPVCNGTAQRIDERLREKIPCNACISGVVWEPEKTEEGAQPQGEGALDLTYRPS